MTNASTDTRPTTARKKPWLKWVLGGGLLVVALGAVGIWCFLRDDAPPPVSLDAAVGAVQNTASPATTATTATNATRPALPTRPTPQQGSTAARTGAAASPANGRSTTRLVSSASRTRPAMLVGSAPNSSAASDHDRGAARPR
jgi:hypothetical protein